MEDAHFSWELIPDDPDKRRAIEARIARYRPQPAIVALRVGERFSTLKLRAIPVSHDGCDLKWQSHREDGGADPAVIGRDERGNLVALTPGITRFALTGGYRTAAGEAGTVYVEIRVQPA